ncbi:MAG TPA: amidase [Vicinamibacterales bacterium]|nr:amidase [Vicinamibacterales bacterium]
MKSLPLAAVAVPVSRLTRQSDVMQADRPDISAGTLREAEKIDAIAFSDAERDGMTANVAANRANIEALRRVDVGYDVEPAFLFEPIARTRPPGPATPHAPLTLDRPRLATRPSDEALAFLPLTALASLVAARVVSSTELTELYLARLKRFGPALECVVTLTDDLARAQAADADREIAAGRYRGPLHGIPYGIKDLFATKNIRTTWGAAPFKSHVPAVDATAVERMRAAGAVLLAKLTTGELAVGDVWFGGKTRNPWDTSRGSSGSSAGPASATAAGLVGVSIGTETGGSIISPSHTCGVAGLRPTYGRSSRYGCMTLRWTMDKVGVLARGVEDTAVVLNAIYGPDGRDRTVADAAFAWRGARPLASLRVGIAATEFAAEPRDADERARGPETRRVLDGALDTLRRAGARLEPVEFPDVEANALYAILNAEAAAAFDELVRGGHVGELAGKGPNDRANQLRFGRFIPAVEYIRAQRIRTELGEQMERLMADYDVIVSPATSPSVTATNLTGHPAITVNAGFAGGLPVGLMFTGRLYDEATLVGAALAYERARGALQERPRLS